MSLFFQITLFSGVGLSGILIGELLPFQFPYAILSMVILFLLLLFKVVKKESIAPLSKFLIQYMGLFFVIPTISIIKYVSLLEGYLIQFILISVVATILTFLASSSAIRLTIFLMKKRENT